MPVHDWTRVDSGIFHAFHNLWSGQLQVAMNAGRLPPDFYALVEQHASEEKEEKKDAARWVGDLLTLYGGERTDDLPPLPASQGGVALADAPPKVSHRATLQPDYRLLRRTLAVRHVTEHRLVAVVEIVSPANKDRLQHVEQLASKIEAFLDAGVHVLLVDLFPPGRHDPGGMHGAVGRWLDDAGGPYTIPPDGPLTLAAYRAVGAPQAFFEHLSVGMPLPDMPLFLDPGHYVDVPLEMTYGTAYAGMPQFWRDVLEKGA